MIPLIMETPASFAPIKSCDFDVIKVTNLFDEYIYSIFIRVTLTKSICSNKTSIIKVVC